MPIFKPLAFRKRRGSGFSRRINARAGSFHFPADRTRFIARRGLLRRMLGETLSIEPDRRICFATTEVSKPFIAFPEQSGLYFNHSHSGVQFGDTLTLACVTPVFAHICGYATALAIRLDDSEPVNIKRYTFQGGEFIQL